MSNIYSRRIAAWSRGAWTPKPSGYPKSNLSFVPAMWLHCNYFFRGSLGLNRTVSNRGPPHSDWNGTQNLWTHKIRCETRRTHRTQKRARRNYIRPIWMRREAIWTIYRQHNRHHHTDTKNAGGSMNKATGGPADIPEPMRAYVTPEGGRIRLEKTNPCIGVISIPSWKYPACKGVLNEVLHNPPRSTRTTQQGDIHSYWLWFLITDVPNDALGKGYTQSQNPPPPARDVHTIGIRAPAIRNKTCIPCTISAIAQNTQSQKRGSFAETAAERAGMFNIAHNNN